MERREEGVPVPEGDVALRRLHVQRLAGTPYPDPVAVVEAFGAVQAQDYAGAKWAVAQRTVDATDAVLDRALADGQIIRTHVLRPTWHFVAPRDIRWLLALTAPRVNQRNAPYYRASGLDQDTVARGVATLRRALQGGERRTRDELVAALKGGGISLGMPLAYTLLLMHAELDAVICSGGLRGKQHTYALLDERTPPMATMGRDEALATLVARYFTSHGPATRADFVWWSGLTAADAARGLDIVGDRLVRERIAGTTYWLTPSPPAGRRREPLVHLLPNYDEVTVGYADRAAASATLRSRGLAASPFVVLGNVVVVDGRIVGAWKRTLTTSATTLEITPFFPLEEPARLAVAAAAAGYSTFLARPYELRFLAPAPESAVRDGRRRPLIGGEEVDGLAH